MYTEHDLYIGCQRGEEAMRKALFERYVGQLHAISRRYGGDEAEAEDLTQESFIRAFQYIERFAWLGDGSFIKWLRTIFVNNAINAYKKRQRNNELSFSDKIEILPIEQGMYDDDDTVISLALEVFSYSDIIDCVALLPEPFRIVFNLFAVEEMKHKDIAELLGIPLKTSTTRHLRAKAKLRDILEAKMKQTHALVDAGVAQKK